jgi:hypothetical protein
MQATPARGPPAGPGRCARAAMVLLPVSTTDTLFALRFAT